MSVSANNPRISAPPTRETHVLPAERSSVGVHQAFAGLGCRLHYSVSCLPIRWDLPALKTGMGTEHGGPCGRV